MDTRGLAVDYVNVLKQTYLALQCVLEQEVVTKSRMTLKLVTFIIHSILKLFLWINLVEDVILLKNSATII